MHKGNDFACPTGTPVLSPIQGSAIFSGFTRGGGNTVKVRQGQYEMVFMHNYRNIAQVGDKVVVGQEVAKVGNTGYSTGPHLHFEIHDSGKPIDPQLMLCGGTPNPVGVTPDGSGTDAQGGASGGAAQDPGAPAREGLDGSFWDVLAGAVGSRALNPSYPYQLSTLDEARLFEELNYLEGIELKISMEKNQAIKRMMLNRAALQTIRLQQAQEENLAKARAAALNSAGR